MTDLTTYTDADQLMDYWNGWRAAKAGKPSDPSKSADWQLGHEDFVLYAKGSETSETSSGTPSLGGGLSTS